MTSLAEITFMSTDTADTRLATRLSFFAAGFIMACWAPMVPFAKANVGADEGQLGLLLLCLGIGSIIAMPLTGWISAQLGSKPMILTGGIGLFCFCRSCPQPAARCSWRRRSWHLARLWAPSVRR
jgi:MFS family permease